MPSDRVYEALAIRLQGIQNAKSIYDRFVADFQSRGHEGPFVSFDDWVEDMNKQFRLGYYPQLTDDPLL